MNLIPSGILIIDKEDGPTSHDVVSRFRRCFGVKRVGHTGTLDPFATGVLVLLVGRATAISRFLVEETKEYLAEVEWGTSTDTLDRTGEVVESTDRPRPGEEEIRRAMGSFLGEIDQIPPMFSAKKIGGKSLHHLARKGISVERKPARVRIDRFELTAVDETGFSLSVSCSRGTYIRSLVDSLGRNLGGVAHVRQLRRIASGPFRIDRAVKLDDLTGASPRDPSEKLDYLVSRMIGMDDALTGLPRILLDADSIRLVLNGNRLQMEDLDFPGGEEGFVKLVGPDGELVAVGRLDVQSGCILPVRVLAQPG